MPFEVSLQLGLAAVQPAPDRALFDLHVSGDFGATLIMHIRT